MGRSFSETRFRVEMDSFNQAIADFQRLTKTLGVDAVEIAHLKFLQSIHKINPISKNKQRPKVKAQANAKTNNYLDPDNSPHRRGRKAGKPAPDGYADWRSFWGHQRKSNQKKSGDLEAGIYATFGSGVKRRKYPFSNLTKGWGVVFYQRDRRTSIRHHQDITYRGLGALSWIAHMPKKVDIPGVSSFSQGIKKRWTPTSDAKSKASNLGGFSDQISGDTITRKVWNSSIPYTKNNWSQPKINMAIAIGMAGNSMRSAAKAIMNKSYGGQHFNWRG